MTDWPALSDRATCLGWVLLYLYTALVLLSTFFILLVALSGFRPSPVVGLL